MCSTAVCLLLVLLKVGSVEGPILLPTIRPDYDQMDLVGAKSVSQQICKRDNGETGVSQGTRYGVLPLQHGRTRTEFESESE